MKACTILFAAIAAASLLTGVRPAAAAEIRPFTGKDFAAAQAAGRPTVVDVYASWCPTCAAQEKVIQRLATSPKFDQVLILRLDFDSQKSDWRAFKVWRQSTLIAFKGKHETGRVVAETDPAALERLFDSAAR
jgi:thiol-disulfide isomerase/thioredoxin